MSVQTLEIKGKRMIQMPEREYLELIRRIDRKEAETDMPSLPRKLEDGNYPALEYARASLARKIIRDRRRLGLSQVELARRAGIAAESLNRLEHAKTNPTMRTVQKIDRALKVVEKTVGHIAEFSRQGFQT